MGVDGRSIGPHPRGRAGREGPLSRVLAPCSRLALWVLTETAARHALAAVDRRRRASGFSPAGRSDFSSDPAGLRSGSSDPLSDGADEASRTGKCDVSDTVEAGPRAGAPAPPREPGCWVEVKTFQLWSTSNAGMEPTCVVELKVLARAVEGLGAVRPGDVRGDHRRRRNGNQWRRGHDPDCV